MNDPRTRMSMQGDHIPPRSNVLEPNVTTRRPSKLQKTNMAAYDRSCDIGGGSGSLLIDSILSQAEESEVNRMLELEGEVMDDLYPITSTQMITGGLKTRSVLLSPITDRTYQNSSERQSGTPNSWLSTNNRFSPLLQDTELNNKNVSVSEQDPINGPRDISPITSHRGDNLVVGRALHSAQSGSVPCYGPSDLVNERSGDPSHLGERSSDEVGRAPHSEDVETVDA